MPDLTTQYLPSYTMGPDAYQAIPAICSRLGSKVVVIGGERALAAARPALHPVLGEGDLEVLGVLVYGHEATFDNVGRLASEGAVAAADVIVAVGGGKCMDTCKTLGNRLGRPVLTLPTIASNCAPVSAISIMYNDDGSYRETVELPGPAAHCFINTQVIADAPDRYLWAGIGDTLAKHYEVSFKMRGDELDYPRQLGLAISTMCADPLAASAPSALADARAHRATSGLESVVATIVVSTGLVSGLVGQTYNCALAHSLYYGLTSIATVADEHLHGEVVAYGLLVQLVLDKQDDALRKLLGTYRETGLPTRLGDIGLSFDDDLSGALEVAASHKDLAHTPYRISARMILSAMRELDGRQG
ncbi:MAG: iron-containing alcohol dehydrogenase family protein [Atopobiaceae bacterium]|jgi:glycerol dehydrogenase|nr:iron-containing alcohol dehydrogenase family protein [Atopobiaceae bacterium]